MLLLCSTLGDGDCRPLSCAQLRTLSERARALGSGGADPQRELTARDLLRLGYGPEEAAHIGRLLARGQALRAYLAAGERQGIRPLTRLSTGFPARLRAVLGDRCPPVLYCRGAQALLDSPCISVVGSRQPNARTLEFARRIGTLAAREGFTLCSGGAGGVDTAAEEACLHAGGCVIVFPAGRLTACHPAERVLYLAETGYDIPFSAPRALARNRLIHAMGLRTYAAQPRLRTGGTWRGCAENLRNHDSPLVVFADGSEAAAALAALGAELTVLPETLRSPEEHQLSFCLKNR